MDFIDSSAAPKRWYSSRDTCCVVLATFSLQAASNHVKKDNRMNCLIVLTIRERNALSVSR